MEGVSLSKTVSVGGVLEIAEGSLSSDGYTLSYEPEASLKYSGKVEQTTNEVEFPSENGPWNLILANQKLVRLHDSRTIHFLDLQRKIDLGSNILTIDAVSDAAYNRYVITSEGGALRNTSVGEIQTFFPVGISSYNPVWITNSGSEDAVTVGAVKDIDAPSDGNTLLVIWNIGEETPGGGNYTIQFGWSTSMEGSGFRKERENMARIYNLTDTTEAGSGEYTMQFSNMPYTLSRGGISNLGPFGVGAYAITTGATETPIAAPNGYHLHQNYPNPFRGSTVFRFTIPEESFVHLKIYNLLGELIDDLAGETFPQGTHSVVFSGNSGGIYIAVFQVDDIIQAKRMVQFE
jgi:hypothetical protein